MYHRLRGPGQLRRWSLVAVVSAIVEVAALEIDIDFDEPRNGPVCVSAVAGDVLHFSWSEWHNLHEMTGYEEYVSCNFDDAVKYADAEPNPAGVFFTLDATSRDRYFSCSKICASHGHKVHVCITEDETSSCECDEPVPTLRPVASPTLSADAASPTLRLAASPTLSADVAPTALPTTTVDAAAERCGDSTSWYFFQCILCVVSWSFLLDT